MRKLLTLLVLTALTLTFGQAVLGQDGDDARKAKILTNLKHKFSQLAQANVVMGDIKVGAYGSLDEGSFTMSGQRGSQVQKFLVSNDDKALFMISDPIDVSMSAEEIEVATAKAAAEAATAAAERNVELAKLVEGQPFKGKADAPVTIIEFSVFQCPYCSKAANTVEEILKKYPDDVKFVFQHFPLGFHPWAKPAAIAAECAAAQDGGAFWSLHDNYFANQKALNPDNVIAKSKEYLASAEIDMTKWTDCAENTESAEHKAASAAVDAAMATGQKHGVSGTPGFFVNGTFLNGAQPIAAFEPLIAAAKSNTDG